KKAGHSDTVSSLCENRTPPASANRLSKDKAHTVPLPYHCKNPLIPPNPLHQVYHDQERPRFHITKTTDSQSHNKMQANAFQPASSIPVLLETDLHSDHIRLHKVRPFLLLPA